MKAKVLFLVAMIVFVLAPVGVGAQGEDVVGYQDPTETMAVFGGVTDATPYDGADVIDMFTRADVAEAFDIPVSSIESPVTITRLDSADKAVAYPFRYRGMSGFMILAANGPTVAVVAFIGNDAIPAPVMTWIDDILDTGDLPAKGPKGWTLYEGDESPL